MQSPNLHFYGLPSGIRKTPATPGSETGTLPISSMNRLGSPTPADPIGTPSKDQLNVHGWLMSVSGYRQDAKSRGDKGDHGILAGGNNYSIPNNDNDTQHVKSGRSGSISSISSSDSVNLDDLIKNNFTDQVDDETDLPSLADLDLDDSADDFWKLNDTAAVVPPLLPHSHDQKNWKGPSSTDHGHEHLSIDDSFDENEFVRMGVNDDLINWSPEDDLMTTGVSPKQRMPSMLPAPVASRCTLKARDHRSGSVSSENSLTSQSTITIGMHHYGMRPLIHPSESTASNSSRSPSRLSDYSAASSQTSTNTSGIPRRRPSSCAGSSGLPTPGGSQNTVRRSAGDKGSSEKLRSSSRIGSRTITSSQSRLAKRATHVPMPSTHTAPTAVVATTSRSTGLSSTRLPASVGTSETASSSNNRPGSRIGGLRSSHIPAPRKSAASPEPPSSTTHARSPTLGPTRHRPQSPLGIPRMSGIRSPTPTTGSVDPLKGVFGLPKTTKPPFAREESRIGRPGTKPTGLKPPAALGGTNRFSRTK